MKKNFLVLIFEFLSSLISGAERSFLDLLSAFVPYFVPVIPAYLTFYHTRDLMNFPEPVAYSAAFVVEVLGMTSISTAIRFWRHNQKYKSDANRAPFALALFTYAFYIVIVLAVNVLLEVYSGTRSNAIILAIALFSLLSVPSGVLISIRSQYAEMLEERYEKRVSGYGKPMNALQVNEMGFAQMAHKPKYASDYRDKIVAMLDDAYTNQNKVLSPKEITTKLKLTHENNKGFVSTLTKQWKNDKGIQ